MNILTGIARTGAVHSADNGRRTERGPEFRALCTIGRARPTVLERVTDRALEQITCPKCRVAWGLSA